jgi:hypothetical protein
LNILATLEADTAESYTRRQVEKLFMISASQAKELMAVAGAKVAGPGLEATVLRRRLIDYLKFSREGQDAAVEMERRKALAKKLNDAEEDLRFHKIPISKATPADERRGFKDLPNVHLEPGKLVIVFDGRDDLLHQLWMLSRAIGNEPELLDLLTEPGKHGMLDLRAG